MDDQRYLSEILKYIDGKTEWQTDIVIREATLSLILNGIKITELACLDEKHLELGVGFLYSEGLLNNSNQIKDIFLCDQRVRLEIKADIEESSIIEYLGSIEKTTGCGGGISGRITSPGKTSFRKRPLSLSLIPELMIEFQKLSSLFYQTGGVHSAGLVSDNQIIEFAEDIGRHNAVDKVIGSAIINHKLVTNLTLLTSGRISSEIVQKGIRSSIPMIISQAAPTSRAINLAWYHGIYLIGFARGKRFNIYTGLNEIQQD